MCKTDPACDPRPNRLIRSLRDSHKVTVIGKGTNQIENVNFISLDIKKNNHLYNKLILGIKYLLRQFKKIIWSQEIRAIIPKLNNQNFDVIVSHDLDLLPLALKIKKEAKIVFDAREYYPKNFEDRLFWRLIVKPFNEYLCRNYLKKVDRMITVSDGLAKEYFNEFGVNAQVVMSLPDFENIMPSKIDPNKIRIIHHGNATPSRKLELMIEVMDYVDERFSLDLMLVFHRKKVYYKKLKKMVACRSNVRIIPPVKFENIIPFINQYDIGLFLVYPVNFNLKYVLPNKLFEFIQARLMVAIGPSIEMQKIVVKYDCGIVANDFSPMNLAKSLNQLDSEKILYFKNKSNKASSILNLDSNMKEIKKILFNCL